MAGGKESLKLLKMNRIKEQFINNQLQKIAKRKCLGIKRTDMVPDRQNVANQKHWYVMMVNEVEKKKSIENNKQQTTNL